MCVSAHAVVTKMQHLYGCVLQSEKVNLPIVSHAAELKGAKGEHGVSRLLEALKKTAFACRNRTSNFMVAFCLFWIFQTQFCS